MLFAILTSKKDHKRDSNSVSFSPNIQTFSVFQQALFMEKILKKQAIFIKNGLIA